jgi:epoxyqueuosine reductase QueG
MKLNESLKEASLQESVDYFGVADLSCAADFIIAQGGEMVRGYPYCVSLGIVLPNAIVDFLPGSSDYAVRLNYQHYAYDIINQRLDLAASRLSNRIQRMGFKVLPLPAAERIDDEKICASFSHKVGAHLAGLGWIGKNCLLITPEHGPRVRFVSILTDALLEPTGEPQDEKCGDCEECVKICPVGAFTGRNFKNEEPREMRYQADKCDQYFQTREQKEKYPVCGLCLYVCPYGRKEKVIK